MVEMGANRTPRPDPVSPTHLQAYPGLSILLQRRCRQRRLTASPRVLIGLLGHLGRRTLES